MEDLLKQILSKLDNLDNRMQNVEDKLDRMEHKLDATFDQTAQNAEAISGIAAAQDRHERILEVLSLRSIEQQAYRNR
ncbi:hypothetical protein [Paenibacillus sp. 1P07SE]|uniref:hypothetical protein n=1 Tax=Paenibacillus sp. 1P07SE TaxID=3132209 RepID=UPI0039A4B4C2